jgi:AAA15 family ATPase/GTPase
MLISFQVKNFRSIVDTTVSLNYAEGKAPNNYKEEGTLPFLETNSAKKRVVPCLALYGANASGKTNLIRAMFELKHLLKAGIEKSFNPNKLHSNCCSTRFEADFCISKDLFSYCIEYNRESIIGESLKKNGKMLFSIEKSQISEAQNITSGSYSIQKLKDILKVECSNVSGIQVYPFLSKIAKQYAGLNADISAAALFFQFHVTVYHSNEFPTGMGIDLLTKSLNDESHAFNKIEELIRKMDFGIKRMEFNREKLQMNKEGKFALNIDPDKGEPVDIKQSNNESFAEYIHSYHEDTHGKEICFNFNEESDGTQAAFGIIGVILSALENGNIICIDELDRSLHSLVFRKIVSLFKDKRYNTKGAQLIFTAHNTDLLDAEILRVSEIGIVSKNLAQGTVFTRLSEFEDMRNVFNFRKKYLNGEFAGIPFPYI